MNCPNCKIPFVEEKAGKFSCVTCGWFEKVGKEWQGCEAPEPEPERTPEPEPEPSESQTPESLPPGESPPPQESPSEPDPAALEPNPAALEPNPAALEPDPAAQKPDTNRRDRSVKKYLGGLLTVTEVDE